jgi:hypothetical protein
MTAGGSRGFDPEGVTAYLDADLQDTGSQHVGRPRKVTVTEWRPASELEARSPTTVRGGVGRKP